MAIVIRMLHPRVGRVAQSLRNQFQCQRTAKGKIQTEIVAGQEKNSSSDFKPI
jgi:hypothetical protein